MAKHLLYDADVYALLDQQRIRGVPGVVDSGVADLGLAKRLLAPDCPIRGYRV